jgi:hypothetical protein
VRLPTGSRCAKATHPLQAQWLTDALVSLGEPSYIDVTADRAYVVTRADLSYKVKGQPVEEVGSIFTIALHKGSNGWRVTGWSWARQ